MASEIMNAKDKYIATGSALGAVGAAGVATLASLCCAGPAVVALLGVSGAVAAAGLAPYRPYFLIGAVALLGFGFWRSYRPVKASGGSCSIRTGRAVRTVLWLSLLTTIVSVLVPLWLA
jgi:mercuric ion transport protein